MIKNCKVCNCIYMARMKSCPYCAGNPSLIHGFVRIEVLSVDDIRFRYPGRGGNYIHGRGMQGRWLRALYTRLEPWGA